MDEPGGTSPPGDVQGTGAPPPDGAPPTRRRFRLLARPLVASGAVLHAIAGRFRRCPSGSARAADVVLARETALELVCQHAGEAAEAASGEVRSLCVQPLLCTLRDIKRLPWHEGLLPAGHAAEGLDLLVVASSTGKLSFLAYDTAGERFAMVAALDIAVPGFSRRELGRTLAVAPGSGALAVAAFQERVAVFLTTASPALKSDAERLAAQSGVRVTHRELMEVYPRRRAALPDSEAGHAREAVSPAEGWAHAGQAWGTVWDMAFIGSRPAGAPVLAVLHSAPDTVHTELHLLRVDASEAMGGAGMGTRRLLRLVSRVPTPRLPDTSALADEDSADATVLLTSLASMPGLCSGGAAGLVLMGEGTAVCIDTSDPATPRDTHVVSLPQTAQELDDAEMEVESVEMEAEAEDGSGAVVTIRQGGGLVAALAADDVGGGTAALLMESGIAQLVRASTDGLQMVGVPLALPDECVSAAWLPAPWHGRRALLVYTASGDMLTLVEDAESGLSIANTACGLSTVVDFELADLHGEGQDQLFALSGSGKPALRVVRHGVGVEQLLRTPCDYAGVTGAWRVAPRRADATDALLVLSFVGATRAFALGATLADATEAVGFCASAATLSCGRVADGLIVQVCDSHLQVIAWRDEGAQGASGAASVSVPLPEGSGLVQCAAVGEGFVVVAVSRPTPALLVLSPSPGGLSLTRRVPMRSEVSCMALPPENMVATLPLSLCVVGTYAHTIELVDLVAQGTPELLALQEIRVDAPLPDRGAAVPESVVLVVYDRPYVLVGLRGGGLQRFDWPGALQWVQARAAPPAQGSELRLLASTTLGRSPVSLVALARAPHVPVLALSDWPWLLSPSRNLSRLSCTALALPPGVRTVVRAASFACAEPNVPSGVLFAASDGALHLASLKTGGAPAASPGAFDITALPLQCEGRPRRVHLHKASGALIVACAPEAGTTEICAVDPFSGATLARLTLRGHHVPCALSALFRARSSTMLSSEPIELVAVGSSSGAMPADVEECEGFIHLLRLHYPGEGGVTTAAGASGAGAIGLAVGWRLRLIHEHRFNAGSAVRALHPWRRLGLVAGIGRRVVVLTHRPPEGLQVAGVHRCRNPVVSVSVDGDRVVAADSLDGLVVLECLPVDEEGMDLGEPLPAARQVELARLWSDPCHRLLSSVLAAPGSAAVGVDKAGQVVLCVPPPPEQLPPQGDDDEQDEDAIDPVVPPAVAPGQPAAAPPAVVPGPERNLSVECVTDLREGMLRVRAGRLALGGGEGAFVTATVLGSVMGFEPLKEELFCALSRVQAKCAEHPMLGSVLGAKPSEAWAPEGTRDAGVINGEVLAQLLDVPEEVRGEVISPEDAALVASTLESLG